MPNSFVAQEFVKKLNPNCYCGSWRYRDGMMRYAIFTEDEKMASYSCDTEGDA